MTLGLALVLAGALLIYAGVKGKSLQALFRGDSTTSSRRPAGVEREEATG